MPEPSPTKPSRSVVVAFTFTASTSSASARAMFARMVSICGAIFGAWAQISASRLCTL